MKQDKRFKQTKIECQRCNKREWTILIEARSSKITNNIHKWLYCLPCYNKFVKCSQT